MSIYLIDYENVNADGFRGIEKLQKDDSVYVFYTSNSGNLSFEIHKKLVESKAEINYFSVSSGKNALDFQLVMFVGYLLGKGLSQNIYIISNDKGFDAGVSFYDNYLIADGVDVVRYTSIAATNVTREKSVKVKIVKSDSTAKEDSLYNSLCSMLPGHSSHDIINISAVLLGTADKKEFHTELVARFKQEKGEQIYSALKSSFNELKKFDVMYRKLSQKLKGVTAADMSKICAALKKTSSKQEFHNELASLFGQEKGTELYNKLKNDYDELKKPA